MPLELVFILKKNVKNLSYYYVEVAKKDSYPSILSF
jgi:hypothetical protein